MTIEKENKDKKAYFEARISKSSDKFNTNLYIKSLILSNVCNPLVKFNLLFNKNKSNVGLTIEKDFKFQKTANISYGYEFNDKVEFAFQQTADINNQQLTNSEIGLKYICNNTDYKFKLSSEGLLNLNTKMNLKKGLTLELSGQSKIFGQNKINGFYGTPFNFGILISHKK